MRVSNSHRPVLARLAGARNSCGPVRNYLSEAIGKLGAEKRIEAYRDARAKGWL